MNGRVLTCKPAFKVKGQIHRRTFSGFAPDIHGNASDNHTLCDASVSRVIEEAKSMDHKSTESKDIKRALLEQHSSKTERKPDKHSAKVITPKMSGTPSRRDTQKSGSHEPIIPGKQRHKEGKPQTKAVLPPDVERVAEKKGKALPKLRPSAPKTSQRSTVVTRKTVGRNPRQSSAIKDEVTKRKIDRERKACQETPASWQARGARPKDTPAPGRKYDFNRESVGNKRQETPTRKSAAVRSKDGGEQFKKRGPEKDVAHRNERRLGAKIDPKTLDGVRNRPFFDFFKRKVSLLKDDITRNSSLVNEVIPKLLERVRRIDPLFTLGTLNTGSYYEKLKVCRPVEFDVMVVLEAWQVSQHFEIVCPTRGESLGFAQLKYQDWEEHGRKWRDYLTRDGKFLSPAKVRQRFLDLLRQSIKNEKSKKELPQVHHLRVDANGPAAKVMINDKIDVDVVLSLEVTGWPGSANAWGDFATNRTWPTRGDVEKIKIQKNSFYLVAKDVESPGELAKPPDCRHNWRISFSKAEKCLLLPASENAEKKYYRVVKYIFEAHREELRPLSSYHLKTLFFHQRKGSAGKGECSDSTMGKNVVRFLYDLTGHVTKGSLNHFFVARQNLLSAMKQSARDKIVGTLEQILWKLINEPNDFLAELHVK